MQAGETNPLPSSDPSNDMCPEVVNHKGRTASLEQKNSTHFYMKEELSFKNLPARQL